MFGRKLRMIVRGRVLVLAAVCLAGPSAYGRCAARPITTRPKTATVVETANFRIYGMGGLPDANRLGAEFESLRARLGRVWLGRVRLPVWSPKCEVVVHATIASYVRAVGQGQFATVGCSRVDTAGGKITLRRLDIRADQIGWFASAVPHELTHVIMADEFQGGDLPHWADEGMAVLGDSALKQSLHLLDLEAGYRNGATFRLAPFVSQSCYPSAEQIPVFYGQSVSLVKFLVDRKSAPDFVRFLHLAEKAGYGAALGEVYGIRGVRSLERDWLASTFQRPNLLTAETAQGRDLAVVDSLVSATTEVAGAER